MEVKKIIKHLLLSFGIISEKQGPQGPQTWEIWLKQQNVTFSESGRVSESVSDTLVREKLSFENASNNVINNNFFST